MTTSRLVLPAAGDTALRELLSRVIRHAMGVALTLAQRDSSQTAAEFGRRIVPLLRAQPGLLASAMRQPSRLVLARCLTFASPDDPLRPRWVSELAWHLSLDAAQAGILREPLALDQPPPLLLDERNQVALHLPPSTKATLSNAGVIWHAGSNEVTTSWSMSLEDLDSRLRTLGGRATRSHADLFAQATLVLEDNNPLAAEEAHPNKNGNAFDLGDHPLAEWQHALTSAFSVIDEFLPEIAEEMRLVLRHVGPVGWYEEEHLSASYLEAIGVVYVSLHPNELTLVEALVHEFQHNKLNLLLSEDRVLHNADQPLFASPVRPDPRPLRGVLLAVHAFQPLVVLYERLIARGGPRTAMLEQRLRSIARTCHEGCAVLLPNALPTERGRELLAEITDLDRRFAVHLGEASTGA